MSNAQNIQVGDVVQLDPKFHTGERSGFFAGCFMIVDDIKEFGALGYIFDPGKRGEAPGLCFYRACWEEMKKIGKSEWRFEIKE